MEFTSSGCAALPLVKYFLIFPNKQLGRAAQSTSPPVRAAASDLPPFFLPPPSFTTHFNSLPFAGSGKREQDSQFRSASQRTKTHGQLCARDSFTPPPSTSRDQQLPPGMPALQFHLAGDLPGPEPSPTGRCILIMNLNWKLQRHPRYRTCANSDNAQAGNHL